MAVFMENSCRGWGGRHLDPRDRTPLRATDDL